MAATVPDGAGIRARGPRAASLVGAAGAAPVGRFVDGETRTRTGDTTIFSRVLYQLSYLAAAGEDNAAGAAPGSAATRRQVAALAAATSFIVFIAVMGSTTGRTSMSA